MIDYRLQLSALFAETCKRLGIMVVDGGVYEARQGDPAISSPQAAGPYFDQTHAGAESR